jgi:ubiquinone/menaquinone biosynthesis C-methylase UbiE
MNTELQKYPILRDIKRLERKEIVRRAQLFQRKTLLLDVGCGLGEDMEAIGKEADADLFGIDLNGSALRECQARSGMLFFLMDATQMSFRDGVFDIAFLSVNTLANFSLEERLQWLREMKRVSRCVLVMLYVNTEDPAEMEIQNRIKYYQALSETEDVRFDGRCFISESIGFRGRLFTIPEMKEMFAVYGIDDYEIIRLSRILASIWIPGSSMNDCPDLSKIDLLSWDR